MTMDWFETLDKAREMGREYADNGIAAGDREPDDAPLSGEWAGAILPDDVIRGLGGDPETIEDFERDDILSFWEDGYFGADWPGTE
jgi:hypothetical protein